MHSPAKNHIRTSTPTKVFTVTSLTVMFLQARVLAALRKAEHPLTTSGSSCGIGGISSTLAYLTKVASLGFAAKIVLD